MVAGAKPAARHPSDRLIIAGPYTGSLACPWPGRYETPSTLHSAAGPPLTPPGQGGTQAGVGARWLSPPHVPPRPAHEPSPAFMSISILRLTRDARCLRYHLVW